MKVFILLLLVRLPHGDPFEQSLPMTGYLACVAQKQAALVSFVAQFPAIDILAAHCKSLLVARA